MNIANTQNVLLPAQEPLNLRAIQNNFYFNFNWGPEIDNVTPTLAMAVANEIQSTLSSGHPLRVYMFNFLSADAYANPEFRDIVRVILGRAVMGVRQQEFGNFQQAVQTLVPAGVKFAASYLASQEPAMADYLDNETINRIVPINAQMWVDMTGMVEGTTPFQPLSNFQQVNSNSAIGNLIGRGTQMGETAFGGSHLGETSGAFSTSVRNSQGGTEGNTVNPGGRVNRFRQQLQQKQAAMAGSLQTAMVDAAARQEQQQQPRSGTSAILGPRMANRGFAQIQKPAETTTAQPELETAIAEAQVQQPAPEPTPAPVERKPLFMYPCDDGKERAVIEEVVGDYNENSWKSSPAQRFHPAWCRRTHFVRYFRLANKWIVAIPTKYTPEQLAIAMDYDAHEIDPRMGKPAPTATAKPPREEAKVLYAEKNEIRFVIKRLDNWSLQESVDTAIQSAVLDAECVGQDSDAVIKNSAVNTPVVYENTLEAMKDLEVIEKISNSHSFEEAAKLIGQIANPFARDTINKWMTARINRMVSCELGVPVSFTNFEEDGENIIKELTNDLGSNIEALIARQHQIINGTISGVLGANDNMFDYVESLFTGTDEERAALAERTIFLTRDVSVTWVKFNSTELSIGQPAFGSAIVAETLFPALHGILAATLKEKATGAGYYFDNILISRDGKKFRIHSSLLGGTAMMISNYY